MNDSGSGELSTTKTIDLKARLARATAQHESRIEQIETDAFRSFEADLNSFLSDARNTLASDFAELERICASQRERLATEVHSNTRMMVWLIKVPALMAVIVCTVAMSLGGFWFLIEGQHRVHLAPWTRNGQKYLILDEPDWSLCTTKTMELPQLEKGTTRKVIAVLQEPCKPVE